MEQLRKDFCNEVFKIIGKRKKDGCCAFCGEKLSENEYCDCPQAEKSNKYFKKVCRVLERIDNYIVLGTPIRKVRKSLNITSNTPVLFDGVTFDDYKVESDSEKNAKEAVLNYSQNAVKNYIHGKNLVLIGNSGTGKTMLQTILCKNLISRWLFSCKFINAVDLKGEITKCFSSKSEKIVSDIVNQYKEADFLFLDDIDKLAPTEFVKEFIYSLVNYRIVNQLPIITSANHTLEELDSKFYNEVIVSRLINNSPVIVFSHQNRRFEQ